MIITMTEIVTVIFAMKVVKPEIIPVIKNRNIPKLELVPAVKMPKIIAMTQRITKIMVDQIANLNITSKQLITSGDEKTRCNSSVIIISFFL